MNRYSITLGMLLLQSFTTHAMNDDVPAQSLTLVTMQAKLQAHRQKLQVLQQQVGVHPVPELQDIEERIRSAQKVINNIFQNRELVQDPTLDTRTLEKLMALDRLKKSAAKFEQSALARYPEEDEYISTMLRITEGFIQGLIVSGCIIKWHPGARQKYAAEGDKKGKNNA
jgi:hypothetical protein